MYDEESNFAGFKNYFLDEQLIKPNDDLAIEFFLENIDNIDHVSLKVRAVRWFSAEKVFIYAIIFLCLILLSFRLFSSFN